MAEITGRGRPADLIKGELDDIYTDLDTGIKYKCVAIHEIKSDVIIYYYTWVQVVEGGNAGSGTGANGLSAYEIAKKNGFVGSETEWLESLKGETGSVGPQGPKGDSGSTPVRGTDYWTDADKAEIKSYVDTAILGGAW